DSARPGRPRRRRDQAHPDTPDASYVTFASVLYVVGSRKATYTGEEPPEPVVDGDAVGWALGTTTMRAGWSVNDAPLPWSVNEVRSTIGLVAPAATPVPVVAWESTCWTVAPSTGESPE